MVAGGHLPLMSVEEARWVRPGAPPDEALQRPFGGPTLSLLMRIIAAGLGLLLFAILSWWILVLH